MRLVIAVMLFVGLVITGCGADDGTAEQEPGEEQTSALTRTTPSNLEPLRNNMLGSYAAQIKCKTCDDFYPIVLELKEEASFHFEQAEPTNVSFEGRWEIASDTSLILLDGNREIGQVDWVDGDFRYVRLQKMEQAYFPPGQRLVRKEPAQLAKQQSGVLGMYVYFADVGLLTTCNTNKTYVVALSPNTVSLESEYLKRGQGPEFKLLVALEGDIEVRKRQEGKGTEEVLIVDKIIKIYPDLDCNSLTQ